MKINSIWLFLILIIFMSQDIFTQEKWEMMHSPKGRPERLEKFRKMRLVEELKLNEEEAVRFFAKQAAHDEAIEALISKRNSILDMIDNLTKEGPALKNLENYSDSVRIIDRDIFTERERFYDDLKQFLKPEQYAKFLLFDRNFGRQIRNAMDDMRRDSRRKPD